MCGIVGFVGKREATPILIEGLKSLEYRGYDSCGIALIDDDRIVMTKASGRLDNLVAKLNGEKSHIGIGHTRWATHGEPTELNSHPHFSDDGKFALVHNGIIENYQEIKKFLSSRSFSFISQTDSEVIAHLIEYYYSGDMISALIKSCNRIVGSYAFGLISVYEPDCLYVVKKDSPLVAGIGKEENYIASDMTALLDLTRRFIMLEDGEIGRISKNKIEIFNQNGEKIEKDYFFADWDSVVAQKDGYPHFMLKEIFEQPLAIKRTLDSGLGGKTLTEILPKKLLKSMNKIQIIACGSAFNAGLAAKYYLEKNLRINVCAEVASEFRYSNPIIDKNTLAIVISQSGETADTIRGLRLAKEKGAFTLAIVNVIGSTIAREADHTLYTKAGPEIAVATTKGYTTQLALLLKLSLLLKEFKESDCVTESSLGEGKNEEGKKQNIEGINKEGKKQNLDLLMENSGKNDSYYDKTAHDELNAVSDGIQAFLKNIDACKQIAHNYFSHSNCFFLGRNIDYALALEGALKYKEISYIHAECYPAGELKHGTISLIEKGSIVIACATQEHLIEKTLSNLKEVRSRGATCIVITPFADEFFGEVQHIIPIPTGEFLAPIAAITTFQLISYFVASSRGCNIDQPKNLAKSVTVE